MAVVTKVVTVAEAVADNPEMAAGSAAAIYGAATATATTPAVTMWLISESNAMVTVGSKILLDIYMTFQV